MRRIFDGFMLYIGAMIAKATLNAICENVVENIANKAKRECNCGSTEE